MTELKEAMYNQMAYIVLSENRPFCTNDFLSFVWEGKEYKPDYGTIRKIFSEFKKEERIEFCFRSINAYYSIKGKPFRKNSMTLNHMGGNHINLGSNHPLYVMLRNRIFDKDSIHNIRLRLEVHDIYSEVNGNRFRINEVSKDKDIDWQINNSIVRIVIHRTNTVSVSVGCTFNPIPLDHDGLDRFYTTLARVEGYLKCLANQNQRVPDYAEWLITMWHFHKDGLKEYAGKTFSITVEDADHNLHRIYSKLFGNGKMKVRDEYQGYPNIKVKEVSETINKNLRISDIPNEVNSNPNVTDIDTKTKYARLGKVVLSSEDFP
jgi:hypothetical protein